MPLRTVVIVGVLAMDALPPAPLLADDVREGAPRVLVEQPVHLRSGAAREWSDFPEQASGGNRLEVRFEAPKGERPSALRLRQQNVKQAWRVVLNGQRLGELVRDENDMVRWFEIPAGALRDIENTLVIEAAAKEPSDDIRVGPVAMVGKPLAEALGEAELHVTVTDANAEGETPCRITIVDSNGSLATTSAVSNDTLAVRPGVIYSAGGEVTFGLPAGRYTVYAGRGFEYSVAEQKTELAAGGKQEIKLTIRREVPTEGLVACDTHVHTLTFSGHGDATIDERMITVAGEGIELPIATDHNAHIDYEPHTVRTKLRRYFTPVMGNEVTTGVGHFNVFPVPAGAQPPDHRLREWPAIFDAIFATPGVRVAILNHARDVHSGTRPFGSKLHNAVAGESTQDWPYRFHAMEIVNSGAVQTDGLRLVHDWLGLLNRGLAVTPVGSSDSHDVARHFVGQGRTYIRVADAGPGKIDVAAAVESFLAGRVQVSYGLLVELQVAGKSSGEVAAAGDKPIAAQVRVLGPHWTRADRVLLFANGQLVKEQTVPADAGGLPTGVKWQATLELENPSHDVHLVAVALGPGIDAPYWPTARPYQPTSPDWQPYTLAVSGAVRVDADRDGKWTSPRGYAEPLVRSAGGNAGALVASLAPYDAAVAAQAAHLYRLAGHSLLAPDLQATLRTAPPRIQRGFSDYIAAWKECERASVGEN